MPEAKALCQQVRQDYDGGEVVGHNNVERAHEDGLHARGVNAEGDHDGDVVQDGAGEAQGDDDCVVEKDGSGRGEVFMGGYEGEQHLVVSGE